MKKPWEKEPSPMQKEGINNILSGKYKTKKAALMAAGYSEETAKRGSSGLLATPSAQKYIQGIEAKARLKYGMTLQSKIQDIYLEGLEADKPFGRRAKLHPDYEVRKKYADRMAEMLGWIESKERRPHQYNFFMFSREERNKFNEAFKEFIRSGNFKG